MARRPSDDPGLPIKWHPVSNGEFVPPPPTQLVREATRQSLIALDANARRIGVSRRQFLLSAMGSATMLTVLAACSSDEAKSSGQKPGGTYDLPAESTTEPEAADAALGGDGELVFDVQTHLLDFPAGMAAGTPLGFPQSDCGEEDWHDCYTRPAFLDLMFLESDTSAIVLSAIPFPGDLLSPEVMAETIRIGEELCGDNRVFMQAQTNPSAAPVSQLKESMAQVAAEYPITAWKAYCHAGGPGWFLDDHDPTAPQCGEAFLSQAEALGIKRVAIHKGFTMIGGVGPDAAKYSDPVDIGPAAAAHPDVDIIVYHSGFDVGPAEGEYSEANTYGVDRLITSMQKAGIDKGQNVYGELGSTWRFVMSKPDEAAHVIGKLLKYVGEDNILWGTDSIWYGSPQDQIESFRAFQITEEFQEKYGYPALTNEVKRKIFGQNAAKLHGLDPMAGACTFDKAELQEVRFRNARKNFTFGPATATAVQLLQARGEPWEGRGT